MSYRNWIARNLLLPVSDIISGNSVSKKLSFLNDSQWWSREQIDEYQNIRLRMLIKHSVNTVPYYSNLFNKMNLSVRDIQTKSDLSKIPILTKSEIKEQGLNRFLSSNFPKRNIINASSSGSTGEPLFYRNTKEAYSLNIAANLRGWSWMGYEIGDKYVKLSQNQRKGWVKKVQDNLSNSRHLKLSPLIDINFKHILNEIESFKPKFIRCYPDPLVFLARFRKANKSYKFSPTAITTTGNTLHPSARREIEEAFGCKVYDSYSCEGNSNVFECEKNHGYHSAEEYGISEVLDKDGNRIYSGKGRLISTDLYNFAHPFIRYDTQDLVEINPVVCTCGRNLLKYSRIIGRDTDVIESNKAKFIVHDFTIFFSLQKSPLNKSVDFFQVIKQKNNEIKFNLVVNSRYDKDIEVYIINYWENLFNCKVRINVVDEIPLTQSGKRKFIINE